MSSVHREQYWADQSVFLRLLRGIDPQYYDHVFEFLVVPKHKPTGVVFTVTLSNVQDIRQITVVDFDCDGDLLPDPSYVTRHRVVGQHIMFCDDDQSDHEVIFSVTLMLLRAIGTPLGQIYQKSLLHTLLPWLSHDLCDVCAFRDVLDFAAA